MYQSSFLANPSNDAVNAHLADWADAGWRLITVNTYVSNVSGINEVVPCYSFFWGKDSDEPTVQTR